MMQHPVDRCGDCAHFRLGNSLGLFKIYDSIQTNRRGAEFQRIVVLNRPHNAGGENYE
jgi:hypothetical protein